MTIQELTIFSTEELQQFIKEANEILESRKPKSLVFIDWEGRVEDIRKGKPYFAILTNDNGKIKYNFVSTLAYDNKRGNTPATAVYRGELPEGTIIKFRKSASWKNDYSYYGKITKDGIERIDEITAKRLLNIIK